MTGQQSLPHAYIAARVCWTDYEKYTETVEKQGEREGGGGGGEISRLRCGK